MKGSNVWNHFKTITEHKRLVMEGCFKVGLFKQGLLHDLSKYSPEEFWTGVRFYQGTRSPNAAEREKYGFSKAWLHHKGRNKHHFEYWIDFSIDKSKGLVGHKMPVRYVAEMMMDRIAACKVYKGKEYTDSSPLEYYHRDCHPPRDKKASGEASCDAEQKRREKDICVYQEAFKAGGLLRQTA